MTTSGTINAEMTVRDICTAAARDLGVYSAGEVLSAADGDDMMLRLNWMLKSWQANGFNLWRVAEGEVEFLADTRVVDLDPTCIDVMEARFVETSTFERPIQRWELGEYQRLPNKNQPGFPTAFYLDKQVGGVSMALWPVPYQDTTIRYTYARVIEDATNLNQTLDIPQQWMETVWTGLAARCVTLFGVTRLDPNAVQIVIQRANILEQKLMDQDRPASVFFGPVYTENF